MVLMADERGKLRRQVAQAVGKPAEVVGGEHRIDEPRLELMRENHDNREPEHGAGGLDRLLSKGACAAEA